MFQRKKRLILIIAGSFLCGLLFSQAFGPKTLEPDLPFKKPLRFGSKSIVKHKNESRHTLAPTRKQGLSILTFMQRLQGNPGMEELEQLFEEAFRQENASRLQTNNKRQAIVRKWGETAPKQGLEKLEKDKNGTDYLFSLFAGWASKNPEMAIAFYEENYKNHPDKYPAKVLHAILSEYAKQSPQKAWNWLQSQEMSFSQEDIQKNRSLFLKIASQKNPDLIPHFIKTMGSHEMGDDAYYIGVNWGLSTPDSWEWLKELSPQNKAKATAGIIMGSTDGNLEQVDRQLSTVSANERLNVIKELAFNFQRKGGLDIPERINWILGNLPESEIPKDLKNLIQNRLRDDKTDSKTWIDSLPNGKKKIFLQQLFTRG